MVCQDLNIGRGESSFLNSVFSLICSSKLHPPQMEFKPVKPNNSKRGKPAPLLMRLTVTIPDHELVF